MPMIDPQDADLSKVTASFVRDARSLLRRADKLASAVSAVDDTTTTPGGGRSPRCGGAAGPPAHTPSAGSATPRP